ncbi:MAG: DUF1802 family protein [Deltaproteobacteria bacterium]|nr:DUF1802 family protein [Deltaproteobacteria bacterium]
MQPENKKALKEWAIVCKALDEGRQIFLTRKGGILEKRGGFEVENREFFLFPTYLHQNKEELSPAVHEELDQVNASEPKGLLHFQNYAVVQETVIVRELEKLKKLEPLQIGSWKLLKDRFEWGDEKSLQVVLLRVYRLPKPLTLSLKDSYGGCKSWVDLEKSLSTNGVQPVVSDQLFQKRVLEVKRAIDPT